MEKLLFYGNEWEDFKSFIEIVSLLQREGFEVAFATNNYQLLPALSVGKLLVVTPSSYYDDLTIVMDGRNKLVGKKCLYFSELLELVRK